MSDMEQKRKEFDSFLSSKNFDLSNSEVVEKALETEALLTKSHKHN